MCTRHYTDNDMCAHDNMKPVDTNTWSIPIVTYKSMQCTKMHYQLCKQDLQHVNTHQVRVLLIPTLSLSAISS